MRVPMTSKDAFLAPTSDLTVSEWKFQDNAAVLGERDTFLRTVKFAELNFFPTVTPGIVPSIETRRAERSDFILNPISEC